MKIIGINPGHNGSVCYLEDGVVKLYIEEERLTREKYAGNPLLGLDQIMELTDGIDFLVIGGTSNPMMMNWEGTDLFTMYLKKHRDFDSDFKTIVVGQEHHFGHACTAFYNSGFEYAIAIVVDGCGSQLNDNIWEAETVFNCSYQSIDKIYTQTNNTHHIGIVKSYEAVTEYCGWHPIEAGKTMGLSSYGEYDFDANLYDDNGSLFEKFEPRYPAGANLNRMLFDRMVSLEKKQNIATTIQYDTTIAVGKLIKEMVKKTGNNNVVLSGGFGLNCVANYKYLEMFPDINLYVEPISHDGGTSMGLAKQIYNQENPDYRFKPQDSFYLGSEQNLDVSGKKVTSKEVAQLLVDGKIVAIYQGRSEAGPRALGNRSILFDPRVKNGKDIVNGVKNREFFRPFASSCLESHASEFFDLRGLKSSPHMMYAMDVLQPDRIPAVTHVDNTCRVQTVNRDQNQHYFDLINEFHRLTGIPMLLNTSFNLAGEPLVETPEDAYKTIENSGIDYLYFPETEMLVE